MSWLSINRVSGGISVSTGPNQGAFQRSAKINITYLDGEESKSIDIDVTQKASDLGATIKRTDFSADMAGTVISITGTRPWVFTSNSNWVYPTLGTNKGTGTQDFFISVAANTGAARTATVAIYDESCPARRFQFTINQAKKETASELVITPLLVDLTTDTVATVELVAPSEWYLGDCYYINEEGEQIDDAAAVYTTPNRGGYTQGTTLTLSKISVVPGVKYKIPVHCGTRTQTITVNV